MKLRDRFAVLARLAAGVAAITCVGAACAPAVPAGCTGRCLTLHGAKNADHALGFSVTYATTSTEADCVVHNRMAGVTTPQTHVEFMTPVRAGDTYRVEIPLDRRTGGPCGWRVAAVFFDVVSVASRREPPKQGYSLFGFGSQSGTVDRVDLACRRTAYRRATGEQAAYQCLTAAGVSIPALGDGSHTIALNFGARAE